MLILILRATAAGLRGALVQSAVHHVLHEFRLDPIAARDAGRRQANALRLMAELRDVEAIGHRIAHGGTSFSGPCLVDDEILEGIAACDGCAPHENVDAVAALRMARTVWPDLPHVAVFETGFHHDMPARASLYAIPKNWRAAGIRRYGAHGLAHQDAFEAVAEAVPGDPSRLRLVSCHLGATSSVCAIDGGRSIDCSGGSDGLGGLITDRGAGDVDAGLFVQAARLFGLDTNAVAHVLQHDSGLHALSGTDDDLEELEARASGGDPRVELALDVYASCVRKAIAAAAAALGGVDAIAFGGSAGTHAAAMRRRICAPLGFLGVDLEAPGRLDARDDGSPTTALHSVASRVAVLVVAGREAALAARMTEAVVRTARAVAETDAIVPVSVSTHHVHLDEATARMLFGDDHPLRHPGPADPQGQWLCDGTVDLVGPSGVLHGVAIVGPCRARNQVEISRSDAERLGLAVPIRLSGALDGTPKLTLRGTASEVETDGVIVAHCHLHTNPADAKRLGVRDHERVGIALRDTERPVVFDDVIVRVDPSFTTEVHIDRDEARAAGLPERMSSSVSTRAGVGRVERHAASILSSDANHTAS